MLGKESGAILTMARLALSVLIQPMIGTTFGFQTELMKCKLRSVLLIGTLIPLR